MKFDVNNLRQSHFMPIGLKSEFIDGKNVSFHFCSQKQL